MDERELRGFLDELQGKRRAAQATAREKADPHRALLEKLTGMKVKFDSDPYGSGGRPGPPGRGKDVSYYIIPAFPLSGLSPLSLTVFSEPHSGRKPRICELTLSA